MKDYPVVQDEEDPKAEDCEIKTVSGHIFGNCPVQAEGKIGANPFYFRARHDEWEFHVGLPGNEYVGEVVDGKYLSRWEEIFCRSAAYGTGFDASWMAKRTAKEIILDCVEEFLREKKNG